ncbi:MAG: cupin domain-containing protein [Planctomycetota bacterium]|jgi:uncharacterized cupin superfamily protein
MPTVKDVVVKKPSDEEASTCKAWPIWKCEPSTFDWAYTEKETCLLVEGQVTVTDGSDSVYPDAASTGPVHWRAFGSAPV